jgi:hypothetical protein
MPTKKAAVDPDDAPLKRLGGGRWQTRDERFTIEPQSGTWVVVDAEQTDDLGLPLVRGPFPSLTAAKEAISAARDSQPAESPLAARLERRAREPEPKAEKRASGRDRPTPRGGEGKGPAESKDEPPEREAGQRTRRPTTPPEPEDREPGWLKDLDPGDRGRARRLIERLTELGAPDPEGIVRRDVVGDVAAIAAHAVAQRLDELGPDATPDEVAELLADGRDPTLDVRWRLVDGTGRPIVLVRQRGRRR